MKRKMVRAWNLPVELLDRQRLLGQHVESHVMFNALKKHFNGIKGGYQNHPQTRRFINNIGQLIDIHDKCAEEMLSRGYNHKSPLETEDIKKEEFVYTEEEYLLDLKDLKERQGDLS